MKKRLVSVLLVVCMLMSMLATTVFAADGWNEVTTGDHHAAQKVVTFTPGELKSQYGLTDPSKWFYVVDGDDANKIPGATPATLIYSESVKLVNPSASIELPITADADKKATVLEEEYYSKKLPADAELYEVKIDGAAKPEFYTGGSEIRFKTELKYRPYVPAVTEEWLAVYADKDGKLLAAPQHVEVGHFPADPSVNTPAGNPIAAWTTSKAPNAAVNGDVIVYTADYQTYPVSLDAQNAYIAGIDVNREYEEGEAITYYAYAFPGYELTPSGKITYTVVAGTNVITAHATEVMAPPVPSYSITVNVNPASFGTATAPAAAAAGDEVAIEPMALAGYHLESITAMAGTVPVELVEAASGHYLLTMPAGNVVVTVTFAADPVEPAPVEYNVTVAADPLHGTTTLNLTKAEAGRGIVLTVNPIADWHVETVSAEAAGKPVEVLRSMSGNYLLTMPAADVAITVTYAEDAHAPVPVLHNVVVNTLPTGIGSAVATPSVAVAGTEITIKAAAPAGYHVKTVKAFSAGNPVELVETVSGKYLLTLPDADVKVNVKFEKDPVVPAPVKYAVTVVKDPVGIGAVTVNLTEAEPDETIIFEAAAPAGYHVESVKAAAAGVPVELLRSMSGKYLFAMPEADVEITVKYAIDPAAPPVVTYNVSAAVALGGPAAATFSPDGGGTTINLPAIIYAAKAAGTEIVLPAAAADGYTFLNWTDGRGHVFNEGDILTVNSDVELLAHFTQNPTETFTVKFMVDGLLYQKQTVEKGQPAAELVAPEKNGFVFDGWEKLGVLYDFATPVTEDIVLEAAYHAAAPLCMVRFLDEDGSLYEIMEVVDGTPVTLPAVTVKGYKCQWKELPAGTLHAADGTGIVNISGDLTFRLIKTARTYNITTDVRLDGVIQPGSSVEITGAAVTADTGDAVIYKVTVPSGQYLGGVSVISEGHAIVNNPKNVQYTAAGSVYVYEFTMPAANAQIRVRLTTDLTGKHQVKFIDRDTGYVYDIQYVTDGEVPVKPTDPVKPGYDFLDWFHAGVPYDFIGGAVTKPIIIRAKFTPKEFDLNFSDGVAAITDVPYGTEVSLPAAPAAAPGQTFVCWKNDTTGGLYEAGQLYSVTADESFTAVWATEDVLVKFVDGVRLVDFVSVPYGTAITAPAAPVKAGRTFTGWENGGIYVMEGGPITAVADAVYHTTYTADNFTVTFNADGGLPVPVPLTVAYGDAIVLPAAPARDGAGFVCWREDATGIAYAEGGAYKVTSDASFTAVWAVNQVVVKFVADGNLVEYFAADVGTFLNAPVAPVKEGYQFQGWVKDPVVLNENESFTATVNETYVAKYEAVSFQVDFDSAGGTPAYPSVHQDFGGMIQLPSEPIWDGHIFVGWRNDENGLIYDANGWFQVEKDASFTASWVTKEIVIRFVADGTIVDYFAVSYGATVNVPAAPEKTGYHFVRWDDAGAAPADPLIATESKTYVAVYEADNFTVTFNPKGGTPTAFAPVNADYGEVITLPAAPTRENYTFVGWQNQKTGLLFTAGASYTVTANERFLARWEKNDRIIVKFRDRDGQMYNWYAVENGKTVKAPAAPKKDGFEFVEWENKVLGTVAAKNEKTITGKPGSSFEFFAVWKGAEYTLHIQSSNATGNLQVNGTDYVLPDTDVATIEAGKRIRVEVNADPGYALTEVYYTTLAENNVTTKVMIEPNTYGRYIFHMPAAEAWLHIVAVKNVFSVSKAADAYTTIEAADTAAVGSSVEVAVSALQDYAVDSVYAKDANGNYLYLAYTGIGGGKLHYAFTMPAADVTVYAASVKNQYTVQILDHNNSLIDIRTVPSGSVVDLAAVEAALLRTGYQFDGWEIIVGESVGAAFVSNSTVVRQNTVIRAVYTPDVHTVARAADCSEHLEKMLVTDIASHNSTDFAPKDNYLLTVASATDKKVQITIKPVYNYVISGVAVRATASNTVAQTYLRSYDEITDTYIYEFTMPAEDVEIAVYTDAKTYTVNVSENEEDGGHYTINGYTTTNLPVKQGENASIDIAAEEGWYIDILSVYYINQMGEKVYVNDYYNNPIENVSADSPAWQINFAMVSFDVYVDISYAKTVYNVNPLQKPNGTVSVRAVGDPGYVETAIAATVGQTVQILLTPDAGYEACIDTLRVYDSASNLVEVSYLTHSGTAYYYQFTMPAANVYVDCEFAQQTYAVIAEQEIAGGKIWVGDTNTNKASFPMDAAADVTVVPAGGYQIDVRTGTVKIASNDYEYSAPYFVLKNAAGDELYNSMEAAKEAKRAEILGIDYTLVYTPDIDVTAALQPDGKTIYSFIMPEYDVYVFTAFEKLFYGVDVETTNTANAGLGMVYGGINASANAVSDVNFEASVNDSVYINVVPEYGYALKNLTVTSLDELGNMIELPLTVVQQKYDNHQEYWTEYAVRFTMPCKPVTVNAEFAKMHYTVTFMDWNNLQLDIQTVDYLGTPILRADFPAVSGRVGYSFVGWTSADTQTAVDTASTVVTDFVIVRDTVIKAVYEKDSYPITYIPNENGDFLDGKTVNAEYLEMCGFTVQPKTGYQIERVWATCFDESGLEVGVHLNAEGTEVVDHAGTTKIRYSFRMPACLDGVGVTVRASFKPMAFSVGSDYIKAEGAVRFNGTDADYINAKVDTEVIVNVIPALGYHLTSLTYSYNDPISGAATTMDLTLDPANNASFTMPAAHVIVHAVFEENIYNIYDMTTDHNGTITIDPAAVAYKSTAVVNVVPMTGYQIDTATATYVDEYGKDQTITFTSVPADLAAGGNYTFVMPAADVNVVVTFAPILYNVHADYGTSQGTMRFNSQDTFDLMAAYGSYVVVNVVPVHGYKIISLHYSYVDPVSGEDKDIDLMGNVTDPEAGVWTGFYMPAANVTVTAGFAPITYEVRNNTTDPNGTVTITTPEVDFKTEAKFNVEPNTGYQIDTVTATYLNENGEKQTITFTGEPDDPRIGGDYTFIMPDADVNVVVTFTEIMYRVSLDKTGNGQEQLDGDFTDNSFYDYLETVRVTLTPATGYKLTKLTYTYTDPDTNRDQEINLLDQIADKEAGGVATFTMPAADVTVHVVYDVITFHVINRTTDTNGTVTINTPAVDFKSEARFTVIPAVGYQIDHVTATYYDENGEKQTITFKAEPEDPKAGGSYTFIMPNADVYVVATFKTVIYKVQAKYDPAKGLVRFNGQDSFTVDAAYRSYISVNVVPVHGYKICGLKYSYKDPATLKTKTVDLMNQITKPYEGGWVGFLMPASDVTVTVDFTEITYKVKNATTDPNGTVTIETPTVEFKGEAKFKVVPEVGYQIKTVTATYFDENSEEQTITFTGTPANLVVGGEYTFIMPDADVTVVATFTEIKYLVTVDQQGEGRVQLNGNFTEQQGYDYLETVLVTVTPNHGYELVKLYYTYTDPVSQRLKTVDLMNELSWNYESGTVTFNMPAADVIVHVEFDLITYHVADRTTDPNGKVNILTPALKFKSEASFEVFPADGYQIETVTATYKDDNGEQQIVVFTEVPADMKLGGTYRFIMPDADVSVVVTFTEIQYMVNVQQTGRGDVQLDGNYTDEQAYDYRQTVTVKAVPAHGYRLTKLYATYGDQEVQLKDQIRDETLGGEAGFRMPAADVIVHVEFDVIAYRVINDTTDRNGEVVNLTENVDFMAEAHFDVYPKTGYEIDTVTATYSDDNSEEQTVTFTGVPADPAAGGRYTFIMPDADVHVVVTFRTISYKATADYNHEQGSMRINDYDTDSAEIPYTSLVEVNVVPADGYQLVMLFYTYHDPENGEFKAVSLLDQIADRVLGGKAGFSMPASDITICAEFAEIAYKVEDATTDPNGTVEILTPAADFKSEASFKAVPDTGYQIETVTATYFDKNGEQQAITFTGVPEDLVAGGTYTFIMPAADVTVVVTFTEIEYLVNVNLTGEAAVQLDGNFTDRLGYDFGETVTVAVTPEAGWKIESVIADGKALTADSSGNFTFTMPDHDVITAVTVVKIGYTVDTMIVGEAEGGTIAPSVSTATVGDNIPAEIKAAYGYELIRVTIVGESGQVYNVDRVEGDAYYFTMPAEDVTVNAEFAKHEFTVVFRDYDGKTLKTEVVPYLGSAAAPETPDREGYTFTGWDCEFDSVTKDLVVTAVYTINNHNLEAHSISFTGDEHGTIQVVNGKTAVFGDNVLFNVDPDDGWRADTVSVITADGKAVAVSLTSQDAYYHQTYTFVMPDADVHITVTFVLAASSNFIDVRTDDWYYDAVNFVADRGYFRGISAELFGPNQQMTRGMFVTVLGRITGIDPAAYEGQSTMSDVPTDLYYAPYVAWAVQNDIVRGFEDNTFRPEESITREQIAAMMRRFCKYLGMDTGVQNTEWMARYTDEQEISDWAYEDVSWAVGVGLMYGQSSNTINPLDFATRAEVAQIIKNLSDKLLYR